MNRKMEPLRAEHIRESKNVPEFGCSITGSTEFDHRTWAVPIDWERISEQDMRGLCTTVEREFQENDIELLSKLDLDGSATIPSDSSGPTITKRRRKRTIRRSLS